MKTLKDKSIKKLGIYEFSYSNTIFLKNDVEQAVLEFEKILNNYGNDYLVLEYKKIFGDFEK